ncbi:hypothetical protein BBP40_004715 [Aspergillus hancockii]|nr:hypothetical protein BBP40_004715 [Aspergillus hancockii]
MEESFILFKFDSLGKSGLVFYDDKQEILEHTDGDLEFHFFLTSALAKKPTLQTSQPQTDDQSETEATLAQQALKSATSAALTI